MQKLQAGGTDRVRGDERIARIAQAEVDPAGAVEAEPVCGTSAETDSALEDDTIDANRLFRHAGGRLRPGHRRSEEQDYAAECLDIHCYILEPTST